MLINFHHFRNVARVNSQFELATRFVALASVGNAAKNKFIYALNVTAVDKMRLTDLIQKTTNEIPCPYDSMKFSIDGIKAAKTAEGSQYFYDFNTADDHQHRRRGKFNNQGGQGHQQKRPRQPNFDQGKEKNFFLAILFHGSICFQFCHRFLFFQKNAGSVCHRRMLKSI